MEAKNHERRAKEEDPEAYFKSLNERYSVKFACNVSLREIELPEVDVYTLRSKTGMTQAHFASYYGFTAGAVRDWEQGKRQPSRTAKLLLRVIEKMPYAVDKALEERVL
ncbi:hypothetical protein FAI40_03035 [Acetobacteraceae bacterium]|nr:hypothetical protein FAI40_03035 [Acetobacteraceae bacterium]